MNISEAKHWNWAYIAAETLMKLYDHEAENAEETIEYLLMSAYMEGMKDAKNHPQGAT